MKTTSPLDFFLKEIKTSNYYCQPINIELRFQSFEDISIKPPQNRELQFIAKLPEIKFLFPSQNITKLNQDILKSRKTRNGLLVAYENVKFKHKMEKIVYFTQNDEEDIGVWQQTQDAFCVGFIVQKQGNYEQFRKRVTLQLKKCLEKKLQQVVYQKKTQSHDSLSSLNPIQKILYKHFRFFLVFEPMNNNSLLVNRIMYYPDAKFLIKPIKLVPAKFTANKVYEEVLSFKNKYDYGYLSMSNTATKERRFLLIDKFDPDLNQNPPPMIGVWMSAEKFESKEELKNYSWALIMEYLRNPSLRLKLSINYQNSGFLFTIQRPQKITAYMFEIMDQPKWSLKYSPQNTFKMPQEYVFNDQQVIVEEDKEESDIESIQNRSIMKTNNNSFNNYLTENTYPSNSNIYSGGSGIAQSCDLSKSSVENKSVKSNDEKELEIRFLKKELEFYKNRCEMLEKMFNNPAMMQIQAMQMLNPLANQMTNHLAFNNPMMYNPLQQPNQQMNFMPQMMSPSMNMMNSQNFMPQNNVLTSSRASSNNQKILNESELYEEEIQKVPEPIVINKELAFNKKKTFEQQRPTNMESQKSNLKKKQSCPTSIPSTSQTQNSKQIPVQIGQFPSQEDIEISPDGKKHYFEYDYKNISFAQQNSFENELNSTHKFGSFEANESQIFGKSPDFKSNFNFNNNFDRQNNDNKIEAFSSQNNPTHQNKKSVSNNLNNYKQFSFDKKDEEFLSSRNSKQSPAKNTTKFFQEDHHGDHESDDSDRGEKNFITKLQMKYSRKYDDNNEKIVKKQVPKKEYIENNQNIRQRVSPAQKITIKQSLKQQKYSPKNINKYQTQKDISTKADRLGQIAIESKKSKQNEQELSRKYGLNQPPTKSYESSTPKKTVQKQVKKDQESPKNKITKNPPASKARQPVQQSDSDSDEELRNIAMKYKK